MTTIEESFKPDWFCSKCGKVVTPENQTQSNNKCSRCDIPYMIGEIYRVERVCDHCDEKFEATKKYFDNNPNCPNCNLGVLQLLPPVSSSSFVIDGNWNGGNVGKKITEKNRQLQKKNAGYSHEQQSIKDKVTQQAKERGII